MILHIDWMMAAYGMMAGLLAGALFFAGLAWGMRLALRKGRPMAVLLPSAVLRIAVLLGAGVWVAGHGTAALAGFVCGFVLLRMVVLATLRTVPQQDGTTKWS